MSAWVAPGATSARLTMRAVNDCHSLAAIALVVTTDPGTAVPEPSALDRTPAAEPLRVARESGELLVTWEGLGAGTTYDPWRGDIGAFPSHGAFGACDLAAPGVLVAEERGDHYFLVAARGCGGGTSSAGRDSRGVERAVPPAAGLPACP